MFDKLKNMFKKEPSVVVEPKKAPKPKAPKKTEKEISTENDEPYVSIISVALDPNNIGNGSFELDWNDKFIVKLVKAGYQLKAGEDENVIVDRWFQDVCRNVVQENFEQWEANQPAESRPRNMDRRDLGGGRSEIS
jgi:hypothetical protein